MLEEEKTDSESSCLLFGKRKAITRKNENNCKFVCVYSSLLIVTNYFRSFVSRARGRLRMTGHILYRFVILTQPA